MPEESINKYYERVLSLIRQKRLHEAFDLVKTGLGESRSWNLQSSFDMINTAYNLMTQYMLQGVHDPKQREMYDNIVIRLLEIADRVHILLLDRESPKLYHIIRNRMLRTNDLPDTMRIVQELQSVTMDLSVCNLLPDAHRRTEIADKWYKLEKELFEKTWATISWDSGEEETANYILETMPLTSTDLCLYIGAVTMSLFQCFDLNKLLWLFKAYGSEQLPVRARQRAIVGIFFVLHIYAERIKYYPSVMVRLSVLKEQPDFARDFMQCYINFFQSLGTEKITRMMNDEIVPDIIKGMNKMKSPLDDKSGDEDNGIPKIIMPNIEDKEIEAKLEKLTKMSLEGGDLYMSTFQNLKGFSFFHDLENWFKPFDVNQPSVLRLQEMGSKMNDTILNILKSTTYLCDNDKYSLVHLFPKMPLQQFDLIRQQLEQAEEMLNEEDHKDDLVAMDEADSKLQNTNYMHELYRLFKVSPRKREFSDIFQIDVFAPACSEINKLLYSSNNLMLLAEFLLKKKYWREAARAFELLAVLDKGDEKSGALYTHLGYAYQRQKMYNQALQAYMKAELFVSDNDWLKEQKAICYRLTGQFSESLSYYKELEQKNPENTTLLYQIAVCLAELEQFDDALKYFFKIDFVQPKNEKAWRAIAWYSFACGNYEQAKTYYDRLLAAPVAGMVDFLNAGHLEWVMHNVQQAFHYYQSALQHCKDKDEFVTFFRQDIDMLVEKGIDKDLIPLMIDMV